jgi:hypothetical protein
LGRELRVMKLVIYEKLLDIYDNSENYQSAYKTEQSTTANALRSRALN